MLSREEAIDFLKEPKLSEKINIDLSKSKTILNLYSENDDKLKFKLHINKSEKIIFKFTNHHSFNTMGLLRLDYKGRHKNPETLTEDVPDFLHEYTGKIFNMNEPHMHIYVENYNLNWAIPLEEYGFPVIQIASATDMVNAIKNFQKEINLKSQLHFTPSLFDQG